MPITTLSGMVAGEQMPRTVVKTAPTTTAASGYWGSLWGNSPFAGAYDTTLNGVTLSSAATGALNYINPNSGKSYLSLMTMNARSNSSSINPGIIILCDRLWHNGGINATLTTAQAITSPAWPARDLNNSTNGEGVLLALEVSAVTGAGTPVITVSYTNSSGVSGRTGTSIFSTVASSAAGNMYLIGLQAGDTGVRSVQSITLSATWTSGTINLVAFRPIAMLPVDGLRTASLDGITGCLPAISDNSCLFFAWSLSNVSLNGLFGSVQMSWG